MTRPLTWILFALLVVLAQGGLSSCAALRSTIPEEWSEDTVRCPNDALLQEVVILTFNDLGYKVTTGNDPGRRRIESAWLESRSPYKGKGRRYRAHLEYERGEPGAYELRVRVEEEKNESFDPLNPDRDEWQRVGDSEPRAQHLLMRLHGHLGDLEFEVGEEEKRFGR